MKIKIVVLVVIIILLQSCYTQVQIPQNTIPAYKPLREVEFYQKVVNTFDNNNFPDYGYYYEFRSDRIRKNIINRKAFLEKLYSEGYNIVAAWYRPSTLSCNKEDYIWPGQHKLPSTFIILLSDVDDSIINYNFYSLTDKPFIECPNDVEIYITQ